MGAMVKALGATIFISLVLSATASASLSDQVFISGEETTVVTGEDTTGDQPVFEIDNTELVVECGETFYGGTFTGSEAVEVAVAPDFNSCTSAAGETIIDEECAFVLNGGEERTAPKGEMVSGATIDLECAAEAAMKITMPGCEISLPSQAGLRQVGYENLIDEGVAAVEIDLAIEGIEYTATGFVCELLEVPAEGTGGKVEGAILLRAYEDLSESPSEPWQTEFEEGERVALGVASKAFNSEGTQTTLIGEGVEAAQFSVKAGLAECKESSLKGTMDGFTAPVWALSPGYADCDAFGFSNTEVQPNGCVSVLRPSDESTPGNIEGTVDIDCPEGEALEIVAKVRGLIKCRVTIGTQSGLEGATYVNTGSDSSRDVEIELELSGVEYTQDTGEGLGKCESGKFEDGEIANSSVLIGEDSEKEQVGIWATEPRVELHSEIGGTTSLIGENTSGDEFALQAGTAICTESGWKSAMGVEATSLWHLAPEFAGCSASGFSTAEVLSNECFYAFEVEKEGEEAGEFEAGTAIECPSEGSIEVVLKASGVVKCTATIGPQEGLEGATYTNTGSGGSRDLELDLELTGVAYTQDPGEGLGKCESGEFENGEISGTPVVIGEDSEKEQVGIWIE